MLKYEELKAGMIVYGDVEIDYLYEEGVPPNKIDTRKVIIDIDGNLCCGYVSVSRGWLDGHKLPLLAIDRECTDLYATQRDAIVASVERDREHVKKQKYLCDAVEKWLKTTKDV